MAQKKLAQDGLWTRANTLFKPNLKQADIALIGIPVHRLSLTANSCHLAPKAIGQHLLDTQPTQALPIWIFGI